MTPPVGASSDQSHDAEEKSTPVAVAAVLPPVQEEKTPLEGAVALDLASIPHPGNKFTHSHSPRTEDDSSQDSIMDSQQSDAPQPTEVRPPTPDFCPGTPDLVTTQLV